MNNAGVVSRPRVYVRIRPLNERELREGKGEVVCRGDLQQKDVLYLKKDSDVPELQARFDHIFDQQSSQAELYDFIGPEVQRTLLSGYNASVFAYGQTGSGKTYTMEGDRTAEGGQGLIPRLIKGIFDNFAANSDITDATVEISLMQIYQERIQDLLQNHRQLEIHMDRTGQYVARDAAWRQVHGLEDCMKLYTEAARTRAISATDMNLVSSRSHMILMLRMQWNEPTLPGSHAQLNLIDLAGSERLRESGAKGETLMEAIHINKSLSALGNVVIRLVEQAKKPRHRIHVPYKDSKLTHLLQSSLGGVNLVHFVLAISCSVLWRGETVSTIEFGKRALQLVLRPVRNAIDYTRLAEMEAMIERMRTHIASLEEELQTKRNGEAAGFLQMRQIVQWDEDGTKALLKRRHSHAKMEHGLRRKHLKRQTELSRIMANLPETFDDLTSHCVLFSESKATFRELGGLEKLVHFVEKSVSSFYRSNAAQTIASVIDDLGREQFKDLGGLDALARLLQVKEERCKEAACVALEAVCRGCRKNAEALTQAAYVELVDLIHGYPNQQVQEVACAAVATIVEAYPPGLGRLEKLDVVPKLLETIRTTPDEVVNLTKAATNCLGRFAHGDPQTQMLIASCGGVDLLIDMLFSQAGDRDHQIPILASFALVNLCCSNAANLAVAEKHPRYNEVRFRLLEGLARAFGTNTAREGFGRATAKEAKAPFPYYGVTIQDKWSPACSGGRPIFSSFMDNPQFYLYVRGVTNIVFIIQDTLYEARMRKKRRNNAVYMGIAIFEGDAELAKVGLKQLDFHGKMVEIGKYTSNCENVLHCRLSPSDTPYVVVPFTSQCGRTTEFALSAFGDKPIELTAVPEQMGWVHTQLKGQWTEFTGRAGEGFDWRCNPQIRLSPKENCRVVFVLSYLSLDQQRAHLRQEEEVEELNTRPRLHGRLFTNEFAPDKRYLKALVPLPQDSAFVASNTYASNCYITTPANLQKGAHYVYIPFTESPFQDTYRVSVYCDSDDVAITPMEPGQSEWLCTSFSSTFASKPVSVQLTSVGRMVAVANSPGTFLRVRFYNSPGGKRVAGIDSYWNSEAAIEYISPGDVTLQVEGVVRTAAKAGRAPEDVIDSHSVHPQRNRQEVAHNCKFDLFIFTENKCKVQHVDFKASPSALPFPTQSTSSELLQYPSVVDENNTTINVLETGADDEDDDDSSSGMGSADHEAVRGELLRDLQSKEEENNRLSLQLKQQTVELLQLREQIGQISQKENRAQEAKAGRLPRVSRAELSTRPSLSMSLRSKSKKPGNNNTTGYRGTREFSLDPQLSEGRKFSGAAATLSPSRSLSRQDATRKESKIKESIEYTLLKLNAMNRQVTSCIKGPSGGGSRDDWNQFHKDIEAIQRRLFKALEQNDGDNM